MRRPQPAIDPSSDDDTDPESCFDTESEKSDRDTNPTDVDTGDEPDDDADLSWIANQDNVDPPEYYINQELSLMRPNLTPKTTKIIPFASSMLSKVAGTDIANMSEELPSSQFKPLPFAFYTASSTGYWTSAEEIVGDDVNEIFDPDRVDGIYAQTPSFRASSLALDRGTNYGVVWLTLLEHLYEKLYMQRLHSFSPSEYRANIINNRQVISVSQSKDSSIMLRPSPVQVQRLGESKEEEEFEVDYVFTATGYTRNAHEEILSDIKSLLPTSPSSGKFGVKRDYSVIFDQGKVGENAGVWLQGCNEGTHGLSDTLLSILAIRGGELVQSIFGSDETSESSGLSSPA